MTDYSTWFSELVGSLQPHDWQAELGQDPICRDRALRIPTGFGKTAGTVAAWAWNRVVREDDTWPRRLVFCLPMRVLVEQTASTIRAWTEHPDLEPLRDHVHVLMGGAKAERWVGDPDQPAVLIGTQDMLLSRALNRGYASPRGLWPMDFGFLHHDTLWILDEVQLMDVGLATSVQLAAFRDADVAADCPRLRPSHTWWMSATLQTPWLRTIDRPEPPIPPLTIPPAKRKGGLFDVRKVLSRAPDLVSPQTVAARAIAEHTPGTLSLVIVNRVRTALDVYDAVVDAFSEGAGKKRGLRDDAPDIRLVHSRFRGAERERWASDFLRRDAPIPPEGRLIIATQVVEAGVDISAASLVTELAPWPSLVQRFGRTARYAGEAGRITVVGTAPTTDKDAAPYSRSELAAAAEGLDRLRAREGDGSPRSLEAFEDELASGDPEFLAKLYPYEPLHVLRRRDLDDLFDTSVDLSGADLDVSRFIRSGEERDVTVFWRALNTSKQRLRLDRSPERRELCPVPVADIRAWKGSARVFDYLDDEWIPRDPKRLIPGMTVLLDTADGGYSVERGWDPKEKVTSEVTPTNTETSALAKASDAEERDDLSIAQWKTIATHGLETANEAQTLCSRLRIPESLARVIVLAGRWHDVGKAHEAFQHAIVSEARETHALGARRDLAKAPAGAWKRPPYPERPGFRHELASTLALFELLSLRDPMHPALLGPHLALLEATGRRAEPPCDRLDHPLADELAELSAGDFDLLAWLVCAHHGKVRCAWSSTPKDQEAGRAAIHGIVDEDVLPKLTLTNATGRPLEVPPLTLSLSPASLGIGEHYGASWSERIHGLLERFGPFTLAFLESVLRAADWRASALATEDDLT